VNLSGGNLHFLGEELSDFVGNESVVHSHGTNAGAAAAKGAAVSQLGQTGDSSPVQFNVSREFGSDFSPWLYVFPIETPDNLGPEGRPVDLLAPAHFKGRAGF
jgi:hypothetical protein